MEEAVDTFPSILNKCLFVSPDGRTDVPTFIFFLDILHVKKYPIIQQVPNNTLYFYGLNRIFNVCSFP